MASDLYQQLGVSRDSSPDQIRQAYRKLARRYHPDRNPDDGKAEARFKEISSAYEVLGDEKRRKDYDEFGEDSLRSGFDAEKARAYKQQWSQGSRGFGAGPGFDVEGGFDASAFADLFGFGNQAQSHSRPRKTPETKAVVDMEFAQAMAGGDVRLEVPGRGVVTVRIPPGADDGSTIRLRGKGAPGPRGGAADLVIETRIRPHPWVRRDGLNLHFRVPVTLDEIYNGASVEVPTFSGPVTLRIPPRSQNGQKLRLRDKGVVRGKQQGDLYIELELRMPDGDDKQLSDALRQSGELYSEPVRAKLKL